MNMELNKMNSNGNRENKKRTIASDDHSSHPNGMAGGIAETLAVIRQRHESI